MLRKHSRVPRSLVWGLTFSAMVFFLVTARKPSSAVPDLLDGGLQAVVGDRVCRSDGKPWAAAGSQAFVMVESPQCVSCAVTQPFSERLYAYARKNGMPAVYVLPADRRIDREVAEMVSGGKTVIREDLSAFGVIDMPTFMRVSHEGVVKSKWTGTIVKERESEVFDSLVTGTGLDSYGVMTPADLEDPAKSAGMQVLALSSIGTQGRKPSAVIPFNEVSIRSRYELDPDTPTVVDCGTSLSPGECQRAAFLLVKSDFNKVMVSGLQSRRNDCQ
jgi:hypothetical protein